MSSPELTTSAGTPWGYEVPVTVPPPLVLPPPSPRVAGLRRRLRDYEDQITRPGSWPITPPLRFYWDTDPDQPGDPDTGGATWDDAFKWGR